MTNLSFQSVIRIAPISEEQKQRLLQNEGNLTIEQKYQIIMIVMKALASQSDIRTEKDANAVLDEIDQGKRKYNPNDFTELQAKQQIDFSSMIAQAETGEQMDKVKMELESLTRQLRNSSTPLSNADSL